MSVGSWVICEGIRKLSLSLLGSRWKFWKLTLLTCELGVEIVELDGGTYLFAIKFVALFEAPT